MCPDGDRLGRARSTGQLGSLAYERFKDLFDAGAPDEQSLRHLNEAAAGYQTALDLLPDDAVTTSAPFTSNSGRSVPRPETSIPPWRTTGSPPDTGETLADPYAAGRIRFNIAFALSRAGRSQDALLYARASLRDFEQVGPEAAEVIRRGRELIAEIDQASSSDKDERHG